MDKKMKPWKYGLIGITGAALLGAGVVLDDNFEVAWLAGILPVISLGYIGGSIGGRILRKPIGAILGAFFGGIIIIPIGVVVFFLLASPFLLGHPHVPPRWFVLLIIIACLVASGYKVIKDFRNSN